MLGRAGRLQRLFDFLVEWSVLGKVPKETDIAVDVFGRNATFDATQDAAVRVYVHKLRRRLDEFYAGPGKQGATRIVISRGEYRLTLEPMRPAPETIAMPVGQDAKKARRLRWLAGALAISLLINGLLVASGGLGRRSPDDAIQAARANPIWSQLLNDDLPIFLVIGDYYIFGETDESMEVKRMVREFGINSRRELEQYAQSHPDVGEHYMDLDLTYLPTSVAPALRELLPILTVPKKRVRVVMMSDMTPNMLTQSHIIYVGYLSGLGMLREIVFSGSAFSVGDTYDELIHRKSGHHYLSQGGNPWRGDTKYKDYGYFSTFAGPGGNRVVVISGTRDAAVANTAAAVAHSDSLQQLSQHSRRNFEALYEVYGVDRISVDSKLLITDALNTSAIWRN